MQPHFAITMGRALWGVALGAGLQHFLRSTGKNTRTLARPYDPEAELAAHLGPTISGSPLLLPEESALADRTHRRRGPVSTGATRRRESSNHMSFELVGNDDDFGAIGALDLIGMADLIDGDDEDFLDSLIEGDDDDLISGDGSSEIIGAAGSRAAKKAALIRKIARRNSGAVVSRGLDRKRRYPLGFVPTNVPATDTVQIPSAPQNLYRPERLVIPSDIAFDAGVADIKVGNQSQLVQSVEVPAALFSEVAINTGVTFDTAEVGNQVSVSIRNKSAAAFEFTAGLVGTIAK